MSERNYHLEKYSSPSSRYTCPACGRKKIFARYVDAENNNAHIADHVGRCNREVECGYHYAPKQYFTDNSIGITERPEKWERKPVQPAKPKIDIPAQVLHQSLNRDESANSFINYLHTLFEPCIVNHRVNLYRIGTSDGAKWWGCSDGAGVIFWFINRDQRVRSGQVKLFDTTGHTAKYLNRDNESRSCTGWAHDLLMRAYKAADKAAPTWLTAYTEQDMYTDCFFGEHLLNYPEYATRPVAIVEAPKTAIIASVFLPSFTWLAVGSLSYLTPDRCRVLQGKNVVLFPDLGKIVNKADDVKSAGWEPDKGEAFNKWKQKSMLLRGIAGNVITSDILEKRATPEQRAAGFDLCDYLVSPEVRRELIDSFKAAIMAADGVTNDVHYSIWLDFMDSGLLRSDRNQAYKELIAAGDLIPVKDEEIHPYYYDAAIKPPCATTINLSETRAKAAA